MGVLLFERELARLAAVHVAGLEEKGGGGSGGYCFQNVWQGFARQSIKEVLRGAAVHVAGLEEKGGGESGGDCF